ncbi:sialic acid synthase [Anopheles sinensis]|uniref:Sialic acid synthase n=1 Tax=Anopheles sinensis TaxID=74873 RepID=A0A084WGL1_ANOSI|nr:sialic acid synthase [Anopheles sinensis]
MRSDGGGMYDWLWRELKVGAFQGIHHGRALNRGIHVPAVQSSSGARRVRFETAVPVFLCAVSSQGVRNTVQSDLCWALRRGQASVLSGISLYGCALDRETRDQRSGPRFLSQGGVRKYPNKNKAMIFFTV